MGETFAQRLAEAVTNSGKKKGEIASDAKLSPAQFSHYLSGLKIPKYEIMSRLAAALHVSERWLTEGVEEEKRPIELKFYGAADAAVKSKRLEPGAYFLLPLVSGEVAAGPAAVVNERDVLDYIPSIYHREWCPHPDQTVCVRVRGNSMEPTISDGGVVAIDRAQRDPRLLFGKIVALRKDDGVTIKRLAIADGGAIWIGMPDNHASQEGVIFDGEQIVDAIIGRVVWWWSKG